MSDLVDLAESLDQPELEIPSGDPVLVKGNCEACFLAEATLAVGLAVLCEGCAIDYAWDRFLDALRRDHGQPPRLARRSWMSI